MRIRYNAPVTLSFSLLAVAVLIIDMVSPGEFQLRLFSVGPAMNWSSFTDYLRLFTHVLGHASVEHLLGNLALILLLGPILEEKYHSSAMVFMILVTALTTGLGNIIFSDAALLGASGVVFMMILLASFTNVRRGEIPLSFILVVLIYLLREFISALEADSISQLAHIVGGAVGSVFGFIHAPSRSPVNPSGSSETTEENHDR
ncbi:rhomboid family intramembrane serine protease [Salinispira pacifica]|uniref:Rhomboid family protein n=1 Tax=Salinispira pacifica TaxID=1307761 RepID=V5WIX8_9SPIO|nr:rhomboid family intramembrane serine protease [Salinispira pacifica]AHC15570.1 Rhomboid family protein [Salinispira pacifica]